MKILATRNGVTAKFSEAVWNSGVPRNNGWVPLSEETGKKILPKALTDLSEKRKANVGQAGTGKGPVKDPVGKLGPKPGPTGEKKSAAGAIKAPAKPAVKAPAKAPVKVPAKPAAKQPEKTIEK
jgi:hypothetical protein